MPRLKIINFNEFLKFSRLQYELDDHFPHVKLFKGVADHLNLDDRQRLWLAMLYMGFYQDGSAWEAYTQISGQIVEPPYNLPISYQRRNLFGGRIQQHFKSVIALFNNVFVNINTWACLIKSLTRFYGNGRWASFTTGEMLVNMGISSLAAAVPTSYEIDNSSGPAEGLRFLGLPETEQAADYVSNLLSREGVTAPPQIVESFLCNWSRMCKGDFYVGYNYDRQQSRIRKVEKLLGKKYNLLWEVRSKVFDLKTLGECNNREGVDKQRIKVYATTKKVLEPWINRGK